MLRSGIAQLSSLALLAACASALSPPALADVTIQEQTTYDLSLIKAHGTSTELTSGMKQRRGIDGQVGCKSLQVLRPGTQQQTAGTTRSCSDC
jgi:hypothetical protein